MSVRFDEILTDRKCTIILGILMVCVGFNKTYNLYDYCGYYGLDYLLTFDGLWMIFVLATYLLVGAYILLRRNRMHLRHSAGLSSVATGVNYFSFYMFFYTNPSDFVFYVIYNIVAVTLVVFGILLYFGKTRDATTISYMSLFVVGWDTLLMIQSSWYWPLSFFIEYQLINIFVSISFFFLAIVLLRPSIRYPSTIKVMATNAGRAMDTTFSPSGTYIMREDLRLLLDDRWTDTDGPVLCKAPITLRGGRTERVLEPRRWKETGSVKATVSSAGGSLRGFTFTVSQVIPLGGTFEDCRAVRIYDDEGFHYELQVHDAPVSYKDSLAAEASA